MHKAGFATLTALSLALAGFAAGTGAAAAPLSCNTTATGGVIHSNTDPPKDVIVQPGRTCVIAGDAHVNNVTVLSRGALAIQDGATIDANVIATSPRWIWFESGPDPTSNDITVGGNVIILGTTSTPAPPSTCSGHPPAPCFWGGLGGVDFNGGTFRNQVCNADVGQNVKLVGNRKGYEVGDVADYGDVDGCASGVSIGQNAISLGNRVSPKLGPFDPPFNDPAGYSVIFGDYVSISENLICVGDRPDAVASDSPNGTMVDGVAIGEQCDNAILTNP